MMNFSRMQLRRMFYESRFGTIEPHTFQTDGDFLKGIGDGISTCNQP
jgi:hypothetical protein